MNTFLHSAWLAFIAIAVAVVGGIIQALTNFHPTDQVTSLIMSSLGGVVIGLLNMLLHKLQGTTIASVDTVTTTTSTAKA